MAIKYSEWLGAENPQTETGDNWFQVEGKKKVKIYYLLLFIVLRKKI